jgi:hypothetical protein
LAEPETPFEIATPLLVPTPPPGLPTRMQEPDKPDNAFKDSDAGLRYSAFLAGWDVTFNYLYHYHDFPVPYQELRLEGDVPVGIALPEYERNHLLGGTLANVFGAVTLRAELTYNTDTFHVARNIATRGIKQSDEFASVLGLDWQLGSYNTLLSAQWFQSHLFDHESEIVRDKTEHNLSLLYRGDFKNETWSLQALGLYSLNRGDRQLQLKLSHLWRSNLEIWLGADIFAGNTDGIYGQFSARDRILLGFELGF